MDKRKRTAIAAFLLVVTISNYLLITEHQDVKAVQFVSIFAIGALTAVLIRELLGIFRKQ